jgi:hypothetical protein
MLLYRVTVDISKVNFKCKLHFLLLFETKSTNAVRVDFVIIVCQFK